MTKNTIMLLGVGPIPPQKADKTYAPGWYSWTLAETIRRAGHTVLLGLGNFGGGEDDGRLPLTQAGLGEGITAFDLPLNPAVAAPMLQHQADRVKLAAIVAYTDVMANAACRVRAAAPRYLIYYGHPMAERQMQAAIGQSDAALLDMWRMIMPALLGGDRLGATSRDQQSAMLGELGALGRLNRHTVDDPPVDHLPVPILNVRLQGEPGRIKGAIVPRDAIMILWLGGYNTWSDEETLFAALERAMAAEPRLHYVSCGGGIKGHVEQTYAQFEQRVAASPHKARYHLLGWRRWDELGEFFADADGAICTDLPTLEGRFGARTRILDLLLNEVPIVTNATDEATRDFAARGFLGHHPPRDAGALADGLLAIARDPAAARQRAVGAAAELRAGWTPERKWAPLLAWLKAPRRAPDLTLNLGDFLKQHAKTSPFQINIPDNDLARAQAMILAILSAGGTPPTLAGRLKKSLKQFMK